MNDESLSNLDPSQLLARCRNTQPDNSHERFCFELFRGAIIRQNQHCWALIYEQYQKLVFRWALDVLQSSGLAEKQPDTLPETFVVEAFATFWRAYTVAKLESADGIASVLSYLKSCVVTTVLQARRQAQRRLVQAEWDESAVDPQATADALTEPEKQLLHENYAAQLWQLVDANCHDEAERIVARLSFVADLKPHAILARHPDLFSDVAQIYTMRRNLKNRLSRNEALRLLGKEGAE